MKHVYIAACTNDGGIYHYILENGEVRFVSKTLANRPMYLDVTEGEIQTVLQSPTAGSRESALVSYALQDYEIVRVSEMIPTKGTEGCHLCRFAGETYVANYSTGSLFSTADGGKTDVHEGHGVNPRRQEMPHVHYVNVSPDGKYLLSCDLGLDTVFTYDKDLNVVSKAAVDPGQGCRHLAYSEDGKYVFCINEMGSTVTVFAYNDGVLTKKETVSTLKAPDEKSTCAAIRVLGDYVYASNRGDDSIAAFKWDGEHLVLESVTPCGGRSPRDFDIFEGIMFVTNELTDNVTLFRVNGAELVKLDQELKLPHPLSAAAL